MRNLCEGFPQTDTQKVIQWATLAIVVMCSLTSLLTCVFLYRKPGAFKAVPLFVTLQMAFLLIMIPFSISFYFLVQRDINTATELLKETEVENAMATMESFLLMCHEWIYTDQFLKTVLWLNFKKLPAPGQSEENFYKERKRSINTTTGILSATYYFLVVAWTVTSIIIDNFAFRMG